jgi:2'-5' RNA ligase
VRAFFAVNLPTATRARVSHAARPLTSSALPARWVEEESLHITVIFLGEIADERRREIEQAAATVLAKRAPFALRIRGAGVFPGVTRPSVWWVGCEAPGLEALHEDLVATLSRIGVARERRRFTPHITIGRTLRDGSCDTADVTRLLDAVEIDETIEVRTIDLMRSQLSPKGAQYSRVAALSLCGEA